MTLNSKNLLRKTFRVLIYLFAFIGFVFTGVYFAMQLHLTDVKGSIDSRNQYFNDIKKESPHLAASAGMFDADNSSTDKLSSDLECRILAITSVLPENGNKIMDTFMTSKSSLLAEKMVNDVLLVSEDSNSALKDKIDKCTEMKNDILFLGDTPKPIIYDWVSSPEWDTLSVALVKDKDQIFKASQETGVPPRVIIASVIPEQFRFFTSNRDSYKSYFEPLKILGNGTKFSYGVAGVKLDTAAKIEENLKDPTSPYYLGPSYENLLDYAPTDDTGSKRLERLTDNNNHYYSYLYTAIYLKQIMTQWENASYSIKNRPEVLATLFNLGFIKSVPKDSPEVGGSTITINTHDYTFGGLSYEFYYSGELSDVFPLGVQ